MDSMQVQELIVVRREPPIAWLIVNRESAHNALHSEAWRGLRDATLQLAGDRDVRVLIVRGAGERAFVSGADITEFPAMRSDARMTAAYDELSGEVWRALGKTPQPVIAMIHGICFGGGVSIAAACDLRYASERARFAVPAMRLGLSYPPEAIERLLDIVGQTHAASLLLGGHTFTAAEAQQAGFLNRVLPADSLESFTRQSALAIAEGAPLTLAAHKKMMRAHGQVRSIRNDPAIRETVERCFDSLDYREGIAAFLEKRTPAFRGE